MSLLLSSIDPKLITLAQKVFDRQYATDPKLSIEMDERRKQLMFQDILYNFSFLTTAVNLQDENIFSNYAVWLFELLCNSRRTSTATASRSRWSITTMLSLFADELFRVSRSIGKKTPAESHSRHRMQWTTSRYRSSFCREGMSRSEMLPECTAAQRHSKATQIIRDASS